MHETMHEIMHSSTLSFPDSTPYCPSHTKTCRRRRADPHSDLRTSLRSTGVAPCFHPPSSPYQRTSRTLDSPHGHARTTPFTSTPCAQPHASRASIVALGVKFSAVGNRSLHHTAGCTRFPLPRGNGDFRPERAYTASHRRYYVNLGLT